MIARAGSHGLAQQSSGVLPEPLLAPDARLREVAALFALGALRALWANTARHVATHAPGAPGAPAAGSRNPLALAPQPEPSSCRARAPGAARPPLADATTETRP